MHVWKVLPITTPNPPKLHYVLQTFSASRSMMVGSIIFTSRESNWGKKQTSKTLNHEFI